MQQYYSYVFHFNSVYSPLQESCSDGSMKEDIEASEKTPLIYRPARSEGIYNGGPASSDIEASEKHKAKDFQLIKIPKSNEEKPVRV